MLKEINRTRFSMSSQTKREHLFIQPANWRQRNSRILMWDSDSAASIARRLQDPLAELVKIDPKSPSESVSISMI